MESRSYRNELCEERPLVYSYLVLIYNPALQFIVISIMATPLLDYVIDGEMLETSTLGEGLAMCCLAYARCTSDNYVWLSPHDVSLRRSIM